MHGTTRPGDGGARVPVLPAEHAQEPQPQERQRLSHQQTGNPAFGPAGERTSKAHVAERRREPRMAVPAEQWQQQELEDEGTRPSGPKPGTAELVKLSPAFCRYFDFDGRLGPWLSAPLGAPTFLSCVVYGLLVVESVLWLFFGLDGQGIFNKLGCRRGWADGDGDANFGGCDIDAAAAVADLTLHLAFSVVLAAFTYAFHGLRCVTRTEEAGGQLALLGSDTACVSAAVAHALERWAYVIALFSVSAMTGIIGMVLFVTITGSGWYRLLFPVTSLVSVVGVVALLRWWLTLQLAVAIADTAVQRVSKASNAAVVCEAVLDDEDWHHGIELPAQHLAQETLPLLSSGWGVNLGAVMVASAVYAIALSAVLLQLPQAMWDHAEYGPTYTALVVVAIAAAVLPVLVGFNPASISSTCGTLIDTLTDLLAKGDPAHELERIGPLFDILGRANRNQGVGFCIGDKVVTTSILFKGATTLYAVVGTGAPVLLSALSTVPLEISTDLICNRGWVNIEDTCLKVFAENGTWPEAQGVCQDYGGQLASISSQAQTDAAVAMMRLESIEIAWIGLTDLAEEGVFVWSDGAATEYTGWVGAQPDEATTGSQCAAYNGEDCVALGPHVQSFGWYDLPCEVSGTMQTGEDENSEIPGQPGCFAVNLPFVCSKPAVPSVARGGDMLGCRDGHWVMGAAHNNPLLADTVALRVLNASKYNESTARKGRIAVAAATAAECVTLVHTHFPGANAAEYSNLGDTVCDAVFNASGVIFDATVQTCIFIADEDEDPARRRRLAHDNYGGGCSSEVGGLKQEVAEMKDEMQRRHTEVTALLQRLLH